MIIVLVLHIVIAVFLIGLILVQKNEGGLGGLGGGGGSGAGGMGGFLAGRTQANLLTRMTGGLAAAFFVTSLILAIMSTHGGQNQLVPDLTAPAGNAPAAPATPSPAAPADSGSLNLEKGSTTTPTEPQPAAPQPAAPAGQ
jgi:preprotein translocase subunit SecG